jgi:hypothetical protein
MGRLARQVFLGMMVRLGQLVLLVRMGQQAQPESELQAQLGLLEQLLLFIKLPITKAQTKI